MRALTAEKKVTESPLQKRQRLSQPNFSPQDLDNTASPSDLQVHFTS